MKRRLNSWSVRMQWSGCDVNLTDIHLCLDCLQTHQ